MTSSALLRAAIPVGADISTRMLLRAVSESTILRAVRRGELVRVAHGWYRWLGGPASDRAGEESRPPGLGEGGAKAGPAPTRAAGRESSSAPAPAGASTSAPPSPRAEAAVPWARRLGGVLSHLSAAVAWHLPVWRDPVLTHVTVPRGSRRRAPGGVALTARRISATERRVGCTSPVRTVLDCAATLPWPEALAVADSALRTGLVRGDVLAAAARRYRGPGAVQARRVIAAADAASANPFESVARAEALSAGLDVSAQVWIRPDDGSFRVDLADLDRHIVIEADSYEHHASRAGWSRDVARYTVLAAAGWTVLRVTWDDLRRRPGWVRRQMRAAMIRADRPPGPRADRAEPGGGRATRVRG